ncbi:MAG TPA: sensor histidine kinase [Chitinophagaceae bacterium]|nr:sensor histidine kinase [Chitinophagaceae bacterium]
MEAQITKIRPAARLISTIGEDLIGDVYAAIVELVKNSYDADSSKVDIVFRYTKVDNEDVLKIEIEDDGHGMSNEVVLNAWLVPATKDKVNRVSSPGGRLFQGKKGIGRYAAAVLGETLILSTVDLKGEKTEVLINWSHFESKEFLEDVEILVTKEEGTNNLSGTKLYITASGKKMAQWGRSELASLTNELRKLKSPLLVNQDEFQINLAFIDCPFEEYNNNIFEIEAFPIIELFDYKISGVITEEGIVNALYENNAEPNLPADVINIKIEVSRNEQYCGPIEFDIRVFDRDPEAISNLIDKGLIDPISNLAVGKRDARRMLDEVYGVNLYREGFRIRPYGNGGIDWLNLDKDRIQNFSLRVSNNQVVGFVNIKPERISHLEEKSARDGLKENAYYFGLVRLLKSVLKELEERRFSYRQKTGKGRQTKNVSQEIQNLFDYSTLTDEVSKKLSHLQIDESVVKEISKIIHKDAERKSKFLENIQNTIAIYQGQATLGKIVTVLLHEGRKPVHYFKQQSPNLSRWLIHYKAERKWDNDLYDDILSRLENFKQQSEILADLFRRLDPLAKQNRGEKKEFYIKGAITKALRIFEGKLNDGNILNQVECNDDIKLKGWEEDLLIALTNLIENSIYWLSQTNAGEKKIKIDVVDNEEIIIHYKDSGPGIEKFNIESGVIFEPGFSKKLDGTGLGLPIAGEAIERLNGTITAHHSDAGAYFTIELKK